MSSVSSHLSSVSSSVSLLAAGAEDGRATASLVEGSESDDNQFSEQCVPAKMNGVECIRISLTK